MSIIDRITSIDAKIERADEHIQNLKSELANFKARNPYRAIFNDDLDTGGQIVNFHIVEHPPKRIAIIIGDAVHNLRTSLDHLACQLVSVNGGTVGRHTAFPIFRDGMPKSLETAIKEIVKGASLEAIQIIAAHKPYKGGSDLLWGLNELDITDKHRLLLTITYGIRHIEERLLSGHTVRFSNDSGVIMGPLKDRHELVRIPADRRVNNHEDLRFSYEEAFGQVFEGEPVVPCLNRLSGQVQGVFKSLRFLLQP